MIARIWRGRIRASDVDAYRDYIARTGLIDYRATDSIRAFAGDDVTKARYYPEDERFLLDFPERVEHFDVL